MLVRIKLLVSSLARSSKAKNKFSTFEDFKLLNPKGKLSVVATPIGNLSDLTPNILKCLYKADIIGCEDRRVAGQLYTLIKNKNIIQKVQQRFGSIGISNIVQVNPQQPIKDQTDKNHEFYNYSNMSDRQRRKFLGKMTLQQQKHFKIQYLKYRAKKIVNKQQQFLYKSKSEKFDDLYGIQISDYKHIQSQILKTRARKGRGILIPLNTYSQTKMFDMVKKMLENKNVAIVSDAGMPCISDPGWKMVRMIRQTLPAVPIQVIGGPSAIDIMLNLAKVITKQNSLTGRFQGFASPQISSITQQNMTYNKYLQQAKQKDFSIHFINSKKLKKHAFVLQRIYGENHKIILTNELTKKYERKFSGSLKQLTQQLSDNSKNFQGIGQMSYLLYSDAQIPPSNSQKIQQKQSEGENQTDSPVMPINIEDFVDSLEDTELKSKQKAQLVSAIFGMKNNQSKRIIYQRLSEKKGKLKK